MRREIFTRLLLCGMLFTAGFMLLSFRTSEGTGQTCRQQGQTLQEYFSWKKNARSPLIMAHRMSPPLVGYAENSVRAFEYTQRQEPCAIQEMDVRMSRDSMLVMMHDATLERTTTGSGAINAWLYKDLQQLFLKDGAGNILKGERIPLFQDILAMQKPGTVLALDMKPGTDPLRMMKAVEYYKATDKVFVICYTLDEAKLLHHHYPALMLALGFNDETQMDLIKKSGLPFNQLIALTPKQLMPKSYYSAIHAMGVMASFSAFGGIDTLGGNLSAQAYREAFAQGGDIICSDSLAAVRLTFSAN